MPLPAVAAVGCEDAEAEVACATCACVQVAQDDLQALLMETRGVLEKLAVRAPSLRMST
jgi:hypothetical protein